MQTNKDIYISLAEQIEAFSAYCSSQPSCPCKFHNENCELKWLHDTPAKEIDNDSK